MRAQLMPLDGETPLEVEKDMILIGRDAHCDLRIEHKSVSKLHCILVKTDGLILLRDLGSTNGTRVNGSRVRRAALLPNDKLTIANFHFRVLFGGPLMELLEGTIRMEDGLGKGVDLTGANVPVSPIPAVRTNQLPDFYAEDSKRKA